MLAQTHIIQRQILEVEVGDLSQSWQWQEQLSRFANGPLADRLAELFDQVAAPEEMLRIDHLEVSAELTNSNDWESEILVQIERQIEQALLQNSKKIGQQPTSSRSGSLFSALLFFLENGRLPWWLGSNTAIDFEKELLRCLSSAESLAEWAAKFKATIRSNTVRQRLVGQFSETTLARLASVFLKKSPSEIAENQAIVKEVIKNFSTVEAWLTTSFWQMIFEKPELDGVGVLVEILSEKLNQSQAAKAHGAADLTSLAKQSPTIFLDFLQKKEGQNLLKAIAENAAKSEGFTKNGLNSLSSNEPDSAIFLRNAGMVILYPFLKAIFEKMGYTAQGEMLKPERAICLLQFLATGREGDMEHELALNKLLCGVALEQPLERKLRLTKKEKTEAEAMLKAVIGHWTALGNTSPDGLRGTFLCRTGKLGRQPTQTWLLQVETQAVDILMDRLPWNFSIIKLPWMQYLLTVDWS